MNDDFKNDEVMAYFDFRLDNIVVIRRKKQERVLIYILYATKKANYENTDLKNDPRFTRRKVRAAISNFSLTVVTMMVVILVHEC